jgi:hypothetical protein
VNEDHVLQRALEELNATHVRMRRLQAEIEDCEEHVAALDNFIGMYRHFSSKETGSDERPSG